MFIGLFVAAEAIEITATLFAITFAVVFVGALTVGGRGRDQNIVSLHPEEILHHCSRCALFFTVSWRQ